MTSLSNRVIDIKNRKTSIRLAPIEWEALDEICKQEKIDRKKLFEMIELNKDQELGLTSAIRIFSLIYFRKSLSGKQQASHYNTIHCPIFEAIRGII